MAFYLLHNYMDFIKKLVMQYAKKNIGRNITYGTFTKWLDKYGYDLSQFDTYWQAIFKSLLQRNFNVNVAYQTTKDHQLVTVFQLIKSN